MLIGVVFCSVMSIGVFFMTAVDGLQLGSTLFSYADIS